MHSDGATQPARDSIVVETYGYAPEASLQTACEEWRFVELDNHGEPIQSATAVTAKPSEPELDWQRLLEEQTQESYQAGMENGLREGRAAEREAQQRVRDAERERLASGLGNLTAEFTAERKRYFDRVEPEVAELALAIAARILRREAQMDPLLLLGAVRVALGQLSGSTAVRLRVPSCDAELWRGAVALLPNQDAKVEVIPDESLHLGDCVLETELGTADLGVRAQLGEMGRSFFDRPPAAVSSEQGGGQRL